MNAKSLLLIGLVIAFLHLAPPAAMADLGVEKVSRLGGEPGEKVTLDVGCGACSAAGVKETPDAFPVSLVSAAKVPKPHRCGPNALCEPKVGAVPRQAPFTYLGEARLVPHQNRAVLRYRLDFAIPKLPRGTYAYVIYCDACAEGKAGTLIAEPNPDADRLLRIRR